jgi:hypothetical protein
MVRQMLHQLRQTDLCFADRKHPAQGFVRYAIHKLPLKRIANLSIEPRECAGMQNRRRWKMQWFLKQLPLVWLFFTAVIIAAVLYSIYQARAMN